MAVRQQQRRGTAAQWTSANPILSPGEIGFEIDTNKFKIGDGTNRWATLTYFTADAAAALEGLIDGAPGLLDTLNELAAAVGDDANFFATVNTNIATAKTEAISAASADATTKANTAKSGAEATAASDATTKANAAQAAAELTASNALTTAVNNLEAYADQAEADAISTAEAYTVTREEAITTAYQSYADTAEQDAKDYADDLINDASSSSTEVWSAYKTSTEIGLAQAAAELHADEAISALVDSAPATLDTLNELAAALQDNPDIISDLQDIAAGKQDTLTAGSNIDITGATISVTGLSTDDVAEDAGNLYFTNQRALDATAAAYDVVGSGAGALEQANDYTDGEITTALTTAQGYANTAEQNAEATAASDATTKANAAQAAAEATAASALSSHESDTTGVHGIADTSILATTTGIETLTNKTLTSPVINGATVGGSIVPTTDNTYDLGSPTKMWKDIYVGPGSLYVNGQKVLQDESGAIVVSADIDENLGLRTSGSGNIELDPTGTGSINIKGSVVVEAGANFSSADGNGVTFSNGLKSDTVTSKTTNTDLSLSGNGTGKVYVNDNAEVGGNLTVTGNLSVGGTVTTIHSETISLADNIIDLNSNFTSGNPTENSGIRVVRGDESNVQVRWNETADKWQFTNDGSVFFDIAPEQSPAFTGTPSAPTAGVGTDTTQVATTAFVKAAIQDIASLNLVLDGGGV